MVIKVVIHKGEEDKYLTTTLGFKDSDIKIYGRYLTTTLGFKDSDIKIYGRELISMRLVFGISPNH